MVISEHKFVAKVISECNFVAKVISEHKFVAKVLEFVCRLISFLETVPWSVHDIVHVQKSVMGNAGILIL